MTTKLDFTKPIRTRAGREYVHGAVNKEASLFSQAVGWVNSHPVSHDLYGRCSPDKEFPLDLIQVSPFDGFKLDDPVWVRDSEEDAWQPRHFSEDFDGRPVCFSNGFSSHTSFTHNTKLWKYCKKADKPERVGKS